MYCTKCGKLKSECTCNNKNDNNKTKLSVILLVSIFLVVILIVFVLVMGSKNFSVHSEREEDNIIDFSKPFYLYCTKKHF